MTYLEFTRYRHNLERSFLKSIPKLSPGSPYLHLGRKLLSGEITHAQAKRLTRKLKELNA